MKDLVRETDFTTLKNNFDELCDEINSGSEAVALSLSSGRKVFIVPEKITTALPISWSILLKMHVSSRKKQLPAELFFI